MGENKDSLDGEDTAALQADLAETRAEMGNTIEALHGRLAPSVLADEVVDSFHYVKDTITTELKEQLGEAKAAVKQELAEAKSAMKSELGEVEAGLKAGVMAELSDAKAAVREATIGKVEHMVEDAEEKVRYTTRSLMDTVKANPIPVALVGAGLAWLYFGGRKSRGSRTDSSRVRISDRASELASSASSAVGDAAHQVSDFAAQSGDKLAGLAHSASDAMGTLAHQTSEKSTQLARATKEGALDLKRRTSTMYRNNPMAFGAAMLAVGTAVGLAIPSSQKEDRLMGEARDVLVTKAEGLAHDALDKVGDAAKEFTENSMQAMRDGGGDKNATASGDEERSGSGPFGAG